MITGTWVVYPWYREQLAGEELTGCEGLQAPSSECSPRDFLLSNVSGDTDAWHTFGGAEGAHRVDRADAGDGRSSSAPS